MKSNFFEDRPILLNQNIQHVSPSPTAAKHFGQGVGSTVGRGSVRLPVFLELSFAVDFFYSLKGVYAGHEATKIDVMTT